MSSGIESMDPEDIKTTINGIKKYININLIENQDVQNTCPVNKSTKLQYYYTNSGVIISLQGDKDNPILDTTQTNDIINELNNTYGSSNISAIRKEVANRMFTKQFTIFQIFKILNEIETEYSLGKDFINTNIEGTNFFSTLWLRIKAYVSIFIYTIFNMIDKVLLLFISICIVVHLQLRSEYPSGLFYPNNENKFPYVFFEDKNDTQQPNLVSMNISKHFKKGENVFLNVADYVDSNTINEHKNKKANYCSINDPFNVSNHCGGNENKEFNTYMEKNIKLDNMDFFAKKFIESNKSKSTRELSLYGLLCYIMAYTSCNVNGNMQFVNELFNPIMNMTFCDKPFIFNKIISVMFVWIFYNIFQINSNSVKTLFKNIVMNPYSQKKEVKESQQKNNININQLLNIASNIFSPFVVFFKILFLIIYPMISIHCVLGYMNFSSYTESNFVKAFCYYGIVASMIQCIALTTIVVKMLNDENKSISDVFDDLITTYKSLLEKNIASLKKQQTDFKDDLSGLQKDFEGFREGNKKKKKKKKKKEEATQDMAESWAEVDYDALGIESEDESDDDDDDAGDGVDEDIENELSFQNRTEDICNAIDTFKGYIGDTVKMILTLIFVPITVLLMSIPMMVSLYTTINTTKSITLDYIFYLKDIFCKMSHSHMIIRMMFYILVIYELLQSPSILSKMILVFMLIFDMCNMNKTWKTLCKQNED